MADAAEIELECPVCHDLYNKPKILPCYHVACRDCIISWLQKEGQGGCPLCRAPILPPTHPGQGHLDTLVDTLPTDLLTVSLVKGHQVLTGSHVCAMCPNNIVATSYCFDCAVKLCVTCSDYHRRLPGTKDHSHQELNSLTAQDLSAHFQSSCQNHTGRSAEVYCSSHQELMCMLCATTHHRSCPEVKVITDVANEKRRELGQLVQRWRTKEAALAKQIQSRKDSYNQQRTEVKKVFHDLQQRMDKRRQELYDIIQKQEDNDADLEKLRATVTSHAVTMEHVLKSTTDGVVLQMMKQLEPRSKDVETQCGRADKMKAVQDLEWDSQRIADIQSALSALGEKGAVHPTATPVTPHSPAVSNTTPLSAGVSAVTPSTPTITTTPSAPTTLSTHCTTSTVSTTPSPAVSLTTAGAMGASASLPTIPTTPRPTGAALARILKVGDRVKLSESGRRSFWKDPGPGTVTAVPSRRAAERYGRDIQGKVDVRWDGGDEWICRMGFCNQYDLELL